jgi:spore coat polysaccharide biosynthesis protein SpsF (cytidylyltransferase family)
MGSHRLPGKALLPLIKIPMIVLLIKRLKQSKRISRFILATTTLKEDDQLVEKVLKENINIFRGQCDDVVHRYVKAADQYGIEYVVRVTGDCPLVDGKSLDYCIERCEELNGFDLATTKGNFPVGIDFEIFKAKSMKALAKKKLTKDEREHLTLGFYNREDQFKISRLQPPKHWPRFTKHLTVDTKDDYNFIRLITDSVGSKFIDIPTIINNAKALMNS